VSREDIPVIVWILVVAGLIVLGATIVVAVRNRASNPAPEVLDPIFAAGIALAGAGAALTATLGVPGIGVLGVGTALLILGVARSRRGR
jgi:hypothetical protein